METAENRKLALLMHLPKWSGFLLNESGEEMDATTALVELDRVVSCLFTNVWVQEGYYSPEKKKPVGFNIKTVGALCFRSFQLLGLLFLALKLFSVFRKHF